MRTFMRYIFLCLMLSAGVNTAHAQSDRQYVRSGNRYYNKKDYAKADAEYRKALSKNGNNTQALYNLGCALMMQRQDSAAIIQYEKAGKLETSPYRKAKSYHNIGTICQGHRLYGEAIEAYKESLRHNPDDNETRYNLALCQRLAKKQRKQRQKQKQDKKDNQKNKQRKQEKQRRKQQQDQNKMNKQNAEQLLNAAMQAEKQTQERMKKQRRNRPNRQLEKNW